MAKGPGREEDRLGSAQIKTILKREYSRNGKFKPGERPPYPTLERALDMRSSQLRLAAVSRLASSADNGARLLLRSAVWDWYLPVRVLAVKALESMGDLSAKGTFVQMAKSEDFSTRFDALRLLAGLRDRSLLSLFTDAMKSSDPRISALASEAAFSLGDRRGLHALLDKLENGKDAERIEAAGVLASIEDEEALGVVSSLLKKEELSPLLRETIEAGLRKTKRRNE